MYTPEIKNYSINFHLRSLPSQYQLSDLNSLHSLHSYHSKTVFINYYDNRRHFSLHFSLQQQQHMPHQALWQKKRDWVKSIWVRSLKKWSSMNRQPETTMPETAVQVRMVVTRSCPKRQELTQKNWRSPTASGRDRKIRTGSSKRSWLTISSHWKETVLL